MWPKLHIFYFSNIYDQEQFTKKWFLISDLKEGDKHSNQLNKYKMSGNAINNKKSNFIKDYRTYLSKSRRT